MFCQAICLGFFLDSAINTRNIKRPHLMGSIVFSTSKNVVSNIVFVFLIKQNKQEMITKKAKLQPDCAK